MKNAGFQQNFKQLSGYVRTHILYHCLCNYIPIKISNYTFRNLEITYKMLSTVFTHR